MDSTASAPTCVGIIMDGNRRWAKERGLPTLEGHTAGRDIFRECIRWTKESGVHNLVFYAFSTENWERTPEEVAYLIELFSSTIAAEAEELQKENIRLRFVGDLSKFSPEIRALMQQAESDTAGNTAGTVAIAMSYGGRSEIIAAVNALLKEGKQEVDAQTFRGALWSHDIPDPDLIIRTGGEKRLSNFLTWQSVYSELFFIDEQWPEFSQKKFQEILEEFKNRKRNFGK